MAWSPDGKRLATGSDDKTAKVWDAASGQELLTLRGHDRAVESVAWSPDGKRLATGSDDKTAKVWDAASGQELLTLRGHDEVRERGLEPGREAAGSRERRTGQIYAMDIRDLMAIARQRVTDLPSDEGCKKYLQLTKCPPFPTLSPR